MQQQQPKYKMSCCTCTPIRICSREIKCVLNSALALLCNTLDGWLNFVPLRKRFLKARLEMLQSGWQQGGGKKSSKCNQSESTLVRLTEWAEIWQGLGGRVRFRKPSSKCSLLWNRKCSFGEEDRHNGDHVHTHARTHSSTTLKLRLPGSRQKVRDCSALLCAAGTAVLDKLMQRAETLQSAASDLLLILHACLLIYFIVAITVWGAFSFES